MSKPYTLKKTKGDVRIMTLSNEMEQRLLQAPIDAIRLTLEKTFRSITELTGDRVVLHPDQDDRLREKLGDPCQWEGGDAHLLWRWIAQGASLNDARDMPHFLDISTLAVRALGMAEAADIEPENSARPRMGRDQKGG